jgi:glycosyltransferase involved in cell wall biosynthesis
VIRVAFFSPLLGTGGTQRHLQEVVSLIDGSRFAARLVTLRPGGDLEDELKRAGVSVSSLGLGRRLPTARAASAMLRAVRVLRANGTQVVHGYQWRPALVATIVGRLARVPLVLASKRSLTGDDARARLAWRVIGRRVDTIVVNADAVRTESEQHGVNARWAVIPSGVDVERFGDTPPTAAAKTALGLDPSRPVIGTVGRLESRKGHEHFLAAAREIVARANGLAPQVVIVGDGPLRDALARQVDGLGLGPAVRFTGRLGDVRTALAAMDVFVLPSHAEGMSNALLEAMAAGRPVVATAVGGNNEVLAGDGVGVLVPPRDTHAMADAVLALLADRPRAALLAEAGRHRVGERYGSRAMVARLERLYEDRLAARAARVTA